MTADRSMGEVRPQDAIQVFEFEGRPLTTLRYRGRPVWLAKEVGRELGYSSDGRRLIVNIREKWSEEFVEGVDFIKVEGDELRDIKALLGLVSESDTSRAPSLLLLTESGFHLACLKTNQPIGVKLRRWLADEVLPKLARGETASACSASSAPADAKLLVAARREERLALTEKRRTSELVFKIVGSMTGLSARARDGLLVKAIEPLVPDGVAGFLPKVEERWLTITEAAGFFRVSAQRAGGARKRAGVEGNVEGVCEVRLGQSPHSSRQVEQTLVTPRGAALIGRQLVLEEHITPEAYASACAEHDLPTLGPSAPEH